MTSLLIDPTRKFEIQGAVCTLKEAHLEAAVANNQSVIAAISGDKIRVMGLIAQSQNAAAGTFRFETSGGTGLGPPLFAPPLTNGDVLFLPIVDSGYFETDTGTGLQVDVTTQLVNLWVFYINYTP